MAMHPNLAHPSQSIGHAGNAPLHDFEQQRLRILRCTAHAMASSPGGLRFRAGTRPWLDGLPAPERRRSQRARAA